MPATYPGKFSAIFLLGVFAIPNFWTSAPGFDELYPFNSPAWSIFYEVLANIVHALLVSRRWLNAVLPFITLTGLAYLVRTANTAETLNGGVTSSGVAEAFARIAFSYGTGVYLHKLFRKTSWHFTATVGTIAASLIAIILSLALCIPKMSHSALYELAVIAGLFPAIVYAGSLVRTSAWLTSFCAFLGSVSYPIYMLHPFFGLGTENPRLILLAHAHLLLARSLYFATVVLILIVSWSAVRLFDEPVRSKLSQWAKRSGAFSTSW